MSSLLFATRKRPAGNARSLPAVFLVPESVWRPVVQSVCHKRVFDLPESLINGAARSGDLPTARSLIAFILRVTWGEPDWTGEPPVGWATLAQIGLVIRRDHTSTRDSITRLIDRSHRNPWLLVKVLRALDLLIARPDLDEEDRGRLRMVRTRMEAVCRSKA